MDGEGAQWALLCAVRQGARAADVLRLARAASGALQSMPQGSPAAVQSTTPESLPPAAQLALVEVLRDPVCLQFPPGGSGWAERLLRLAAAAAAADELTDELADAHAELLLKPPASREDVPGWAFRTVSALSPDAPCRAHRRCRALQSLSIGCSAGRKALSPQHQSQLSLT